MAKLDTIFMLIVAKLYLQNHSGHSGETIQVILAKRCRSRIADFVNDIMLLENVVSFSHKP